MSTTHTQSLRQYVNLGTLAVLLTAAITWDAVGQGPAEFHSIVTASNRRFLGTRSCAAVACHGDAEAPGVSGQEFVYWVENDPHGRANLSLHSEVGQRMMKALNIKVGDSGYQNCQACHDPYVQMSTVTPRLSEAVGCEACHGPSEQWVADHYKAHWRVLSSAEKSDRCMTDTQNIVARARLCVKCHVGAADREVNHDMIAAGHPPLKFELAAYHEMLPKHWDACAERSNNRDFELLLWGYGQLAGAEAALTVLETRANRAAAALSVAKSSLPNESESLPKPSTSRDTGQFPHHAWPELAEYNCFSCHKDLVEPSWRQQRGYPRRIGMANWQTWYFTLPLGATARAVGQTVDIDSKIDALRMLMETRYDTNPKSVAEAAEKSKKEVSKVLDALKLPSIVRAVEKSILGQMLASQGADGGYVRNWDTAAQVYLSIFALQRNGQTGQMPASFGKVRNSLAFPDAYNSPRSFTGPYDSTEPTAKKSPRQDVQGTLEKLLGTLSVQEVGNKTSE